MEKGVTVKRKNDAGVERTDRTLNLNELRQFAKRTSRLHKDGREHFYMCAFTRGDEEELDPQKKREIYKISQRVHSYCPAFLKVQECSDGKVCYWGCTGHLGHVTATPTLPVTKADENEIIALLKLGLDSAKVSKADPIEFEQGYARFLSWLREKSPKMLSRAREFALFNIISLPTPAHHHPAH
ncbi:hypothetical protein Aduo_000990 [Ancylostoma duodenale]